MRATRTSDSALVVAAQSGDHRALDELVTTHLPLVYTVVRRGMVGRPDVDDVVQDVMIRAVRELPRLRDPDSFRAWLTAIALRHVSTHLHHERVAVERTSALDELAEEPDDADVEGLTLVRLELSAQRRQAVRASQWLDPDDRALLSVWWLEAAGQLTRTELAATLEVSVAHAGVRVQRMRGQFDLSRAVEAALSARPGCRELGGVLAGWDGVPSPLWRKRIARHTRSCAACGRASDGLVAAERLLVGFALMPVPMTLTAALVGKVGIPATVGSTAAKAGLLSQLAQAIGAHPVVATVAAGALVIGTTVTTAGWPPRHPSAPAAIAATPTRVPARPTGAGGPTAQPPPPANVVPSASATGSPTNGLVSLESLNSPGTFVTTVRDLAVLQPLGPGSAEPARQRATFRVTTGLADPNCFSFRALDGRYLRHASWRLQLTADEGTTLFRADATFCVRAGTAAGSVWLQSSNYPNAFVHRRGDELWVDFTDGSAAFQADSSFQVRVPLAG
jgi:RNA polymerase sigma factor (sigma-70 family)